jgi:hypothetical protein
MRESAAGGHPAYKASIHGIYAHHHWPFKGGEANLMPVVWPGISLA